jgi:hypothetical protein
MSMSMTKQVFVAVQVVEVVDRFWVECCLDLRRGCVPAANIAPLPIPRYWCHRYLMTRLSLKVVYLWRHVSSTAPPFILWWLNLEILFAPPQPQLSLFRRAALSSNSNGTRSYIAERTQSAVYIGRCLWLVLVINVVIKKTLSCYFFFT